MRYLRVWAEFLRLSFRKYPVLTTVLLAGMTVDMAVPAAVALTLRGVINASAAREVHAAVYAAVGVGLVTSLEYALGQVTSWLRVLMVERVGLTDIENGITESVYGIEGIAHLELPEYLDRVATVRDPWGLANSLWSMLIAVFNTGQVVVTLVVLGSVSPWLLFLLAFAAAPLWFDSRGRLGVAKAETDSAEDFRLQRHLFEMATSPKAGKEIRLAAEADEVAARQEAAWNAAVQVRLRARIAAAMWRAAGWAVFAIGFVGGLALVIWQASRGHGSVGNVVLIFTVANSLRMSIQTAVFRSTATAGYQSLLDAFIWLRKYTLTERAAAAALDRSAPPARLSSGIVLSGLSYIYPGTSRPALDDVSVTLPTGAVVAVVGEYGSGKTTLVKLLCKFYQPAAGTITVDGTDLAALDTAAWRAGISAAFQDFGRYNATFREAVQLGGMDGDALPDDDAVVLAAVAEADAEDLLARLPGGLDTELGAKFGGTELSEGQWQKTALARACMRPLPALLVLDEPTASLDAPSEHAVFQHHMARARATAQQGGTITVIVSHRFSTVAGADLILVMDDGRLVESGTHDALLAANGRYADLYNIQSDAYAT